MLIAKAGHCSYYLHELLVSDLTIDFHASLVAQLFVLSVVFLLLVDLMKLDFEHYLSIVFNWLPIFNKHIKNEYLYKSPGQLG